MKGFRRDLLEILRLLENYPLKSYSELAKLTDFSTQTFIRRVEELQKQEIIREVHSSLKPENLLLERYLVFFTSSSILDIKKLELSCDLHPYTSSRNRVFGPDYGLFTVFDIPKGSKETFLLFLEELLKRNYCKKYTIHYSTGKRVFHPQPFYHNIIDLEEFDLEGYFSRKITNKNTGQGIGREEDFSFIDLHPIDLLILRDITKDFRKPMTKLLEEYRTYLQVKQGELEDYVFPEEFRPFLEDYFSKERTENAIYIDFKRRYKSLINNHVESYWLEVNRKYFELFVRFGYVFIGLSEEEKDRLFNIIQQNRPPFSIYLEDLDKDLFMSVSLPPYYQTRLAYFIKERYNKFFTYLLDSFGYNAIKYRFYVENYDLKNKKWRDDEEWMVFGVLKRIDEKLSVNEFRGVQT
ncbi:MAG: winged helix-turn-helix domain-containing protein [Candidatus Heimdallarchaeaceae archaeon]